MVDPSRETEVAEIDPGVLYRRWRRGEPTEIIDVRRATSYYETHVPGARLVPMEELDPRALEKARAPGQPLFVICQIGVRSLEAARLLLRAGHENVVNVSGGTRAWEQEGYPVVHERGRGVPSSRLPLLVVGSLAALGSVLVGFVDPVLSAVPAVAGVALAHASVGGCGALASIVARMPWIRSHGSSLPRRRALATRPGTRL